ncbi:MAG: redoxin domain-containing protein [Dehalococcoidia bacterium]|nr:redoxin domain-containing protein [Dehalococcoidia bacterium]
MGRFGKSGLWRAMAASAALALVVAACGGGEGPAAGDARGMQATGVALEKAAQGQATAGTAIVQVTPGATATGATGATSKQATPGTGAAGAIGSLPGQAAIRFTLPSARGQEVSLAGYQGSKNVVLVFYRAFW